MEKPKPYYLTPVNRAKLNDISEHQIAWFVNLAAREREYTFSGGTSVENVLTKLGLIEDEKLLHAALMLFGKEPQRFCPATIVKCSHYYGIEATRPIPNHQEFGGTLFTQVNDSADFVLSKLDRTISGREEEISAKITLEIPKEAIREIIVNAVVHRDYDSMGSIQITVFSDRVEILNPGTLPKGLRVEDLMRKHISIPVNPFLARPFYLAAYINRLGYGTRNVILACEKAGLPPPVFQQLNQQFSVTIWRNWLTEDRLSEFNLNPRQLQAMHFLKVHKKITNSEYQRRFEVAKRTATQDLQYLLSLGLVEKEGTTGKGVFYRIAKGALMGHKGRNE